METSVRLVGARPDANRREIVARKSLALDPFALPTTVLPKLSDCPSPSAQKAIKFCAINQLGVRVDGTKHTRNRVWAGARRELIKTLFCVEINFY